MIISASRRTDIPTYYSEWFFNRIKEQYVLVRNPMSIHQVSRISLSPEVVDGIVFWTKNPTPMIKRINELSDYMFYFQFTITPYGRDIEPSIPDKNQIILPAFKTISKAIGKKRVVWRYDPILINERYTMQYHIKAFEKIAYELHEYTEKVTISFIDVDYKGVKNNISELNLLTFDASMQIELSAQLADIARNYGLRIDTCAEKIDLRKYGIEHAHCIDDRLFSELLCCNLKMDKDKNQRLECGCVASIDIGMYNSCMNGCRYCYANYSQRTVSGNREKHNPFSPLIVGEVKEDDKVTERKVKSYKDNQMSIFDL